MGAWNVGPFENDTALDYYSMLDGCNAKGINAFLWMALDSKHEEVVTLAIAIIGLINNGKNERLFCGAEDEYTNYIIKTAKKNEYLRKEALRKIDRMLDEKDTMYFDWEERKEILKLLKEKLV